MARTNEDLLMDDALAAAFMNEDETTALAGLEQEDAPAETTEAADETTADEEDDGWDNTDEFPGQLAVDVYETADKLVVKARTAGISKSDLDVSISDNILTISGILSGGEDENTIRWHIQECYWGEFSRSIALPVPVSDDENSVKAELKDGVLTITFVKLKADTTRRIAIE